MTVIRSYIFLNSLRCSKFSLVWQFRMGNQSFGILEICPKRGAKPSNEAKEIFECLYKIISIFSAATLKTSHWFLISQQARVNFEINYMLSMTMGPPVDGFLIWMQSSDLDGAAERRAPLRWKAERRRLNVEVTHPGARCAPAGCCCCCCCSGVVEPLRATLGACFFIILTAVAASKRKSKKTKRKSQLSHGALPI